MTPTQCRIHFLGLAVEEGRKEAVAFWLNELTPVFEDDEEIEELDDEPEEEDPLEPFENVD